MNTLAARSDYKLQFVLIALILLPLSAYMAFSMSLSADLSILKGDQLRRLPVTRLPVINNEVAKEFFNRAVTMTLSAHWSEAETKYNRNSSEYFDAVAWNAFKEFQREDGAAEYMAKNQIVRYVVALEDPVVVKTFVREGQVNFLVQGYFLKTYRGRSTQRSRPFYVNATIRALSTPEHGSAIKIIDYSEAAG